MVFLLLKSLRLWWFTIYLPRRMDNSSELMSAFGCFVLRIFMSKPKGGRWCFKTTQWCHVWRHDSNYSPKMSPDTSHVHVTPIFVVFVRVLGLKSFCRQSSCILCSTIITKANSVFLSERAKFNLDEFKQEEITIRHRCTVQHKHPLLFFQVKNRNSAYFRFLGAT